MYEGAKESYIVSKLALDGKMEIQGIGAAFSSTPMPTPTPRKQSLVALGVQLGVSLTLLTFGMTTCTHVRILACSRECVYMGECKHGGVKLDDGGRGGRQIACRTLIKVGGMRSRDDPVLDFVHLCCT